MTTFLQLTKDVARDSGTVADLTTPATTIGQTGRLLRIVTWTTEAYQDIQLIRGDWRWLRTEFSGTTIAATQRYDAAGMGITTRFRNWLFEGENGHSSFTSYLTSAGQTEETPLEFVQWNDFRRIYMFGSNATDTGAPRIVTVDMQSKLVFYPIPDAIYTIQGEYYKSPQILAADLDVPEMPETFHAMIKWHALILLGTYDEATDQLQLWLQAEAKHLAALERDQTPRIQLTGPLA